MLMVNFRIFTFFSLKQSTYCKQNYPVDIIILKPYWQPTDHREPLTTWCKNVHQGSRVFSNGLSCIWTKWTLNNIVITINEVKIRCTIQNLKPVFLVWKIFINCYNQLLPGSSEKS